ncbi:MAG: right-handed parallel beta-helix repeat-containing protein [Candidatus Cloacimonetes bacterium]|nr:right-handed parallel beta-helix repeat-containing protein [Candidatus Cloacimonadota bacterium]
MKHVFVIFCLTLCLFIPLFSTTITVPGDYTTIQAAINASATHDTILVAEDTYFENIVIEAKEICIASHYILDSSTLHITNTIIDGSAALNPDEASVITLIAGSEPHCVPRIIGFTIKGGSGTLITVTEEGESIEKKVGGGIYNEGTDAIMSNCYIEDNDVEDDGGGSYSLDGKMNLGGEVENEGGWEEGEGRPPMINPGGNHFANNTAGAGNSIYYKYDNQSDDDTLKVENCFFDVYNSQDEAISNYWCFSDVAVSFEGGSGTLDAILQDVHVSPTGSDDNTGLTAQDPLLTIDKALSLVYADIVDTVNIHLAEGTYSPSQTGENFPLNMVNYVSLLGSETGQTIIDAEATSNNPDRVMQFVSSYGVSVSNLKITGGYKSHGAGMLMQHGASPTLRNVEISQNYAGASGGGFLLINAHPLFYDVIIRQNTADMYGAGGKISSGSVPWFSNCEITDNNTSHWGGGIYTSSATPRINNCIFSENSANRGGALYDGGYGPVEVINCTITNNNAVLGAGYYCYTSGIDSQLIGNVITNNTATYGAVLYAGMSAPNLINNTIANNETDNGAIYLINGASPSLINNIITGNIGTNSPTIWLQDYDCDPFIRNCLIEGGVDSFGGSGSGVNYVGEGTTPIADIVFEAAPEFTSPTDGAGDQYDGSLADWSQQISSIITNSGSTSTAGFDLPALDIAGNPRIYGDSEVDLGAYELQSNPQLNMSFYASIQQGTSPLLVTFTPITNKPVNSYTWTTSDGMVSFATIASLQFDNIGSIDVTLTCTTSGGENAFHTKSGYIDIYPDNHWSGTLNGDITWGPGIEIIEDDVLIAPSCTLTVMPATEVKFREDVKLSVQGRVLAEGTVTDSIFFTSFDPDSYTWNGIRYETQVAHSNRFDYCSFRYAGETPAYRYGAAFSVVEYAPLSIKHSTFANNSALGGGAIYFKDASPTLESSMITNNHADFYGGGIYLDNSDARIINSIICNNTASSGYGADGGGLALIASSPQIYNTTIANNFADECGGGITLSNDSDADIRNSIFWGNTSPLGEQVAIGDPDSDPYFNCCTMEGGLSDFYGGGAGHEYDTSRWEGSFESNPLFVAPTLGINENGIAADWSLQAASICINTGNQDTLGMYLGYTDFGGNDRVYTGNLARVDVGAYEYADEPQFSVDFSGDPLSGNSPLEVNFSAISNCDMDSWNWQFGNGGGSILHEPSVIYHNSGLYDVQLQASNAGGNAQRSKPSYIEVLPDEEISGHISSNTYWDADTVRIVGEVTVDSSVTLEIAPGVTVLFMGHYRLNINGCILAEGAVRDSIRFTASDPLVGWHGVRFNNTPVENDTSYFAYCVFEHGLSDDTAEKGGAISIENFDFVHISYCRITNNTASGSFSRGGGISLVNSDARIINNIICNNQATGYLNQGGGIFIDNGMPRIVGNIICNNEARYGGGVAIHNGTWCFFSSNTIFNNVATNHGGGLAFWYGSDPPIQNCIIGGNTATYGDQIYLMHNTCDPYFYYNDIQNGLAGFEGSGAGTEYETSRYHDNFSDFPLFAQASGGAGLAYSGHGADWRLLVNSPCIDVGNPLVPLYELPEFDLLGNIRIRDSIIDIGALEYAEIIPEPEILTDPTEFTLNTWIGNSFIRPLNIANIGEDSSTLEYSIFVQDSGATRDLTGSTFDIAETEYTPGGTYDLSITVFNASPDMEWIDEVQLHIPAGVTANSSTTLIGGSSDLTSNGASGYGVTIIWFDPDGGWGNIRGGETATATVNVTFDPGASGQFNFNWDISGDDYGGGVHDISGTDSMQEQLGTLAVTYPVGGEVWAVSPIGQMNVTWDHITRFPYVNIEISYNGGSAWSDLVSYTANDGSYQWLPGATLSEQCLIRVSSTDGQVQGISASTFTIYQPSTWISLDDVSGTVPVGTDSNRVLFVQTSGLTAGDYNAEIVIFSNDSIIPRTSIPVSLTLTDATQAVIDVDTSDMDFGSVQVGSQETLPLQITNTGNIALTGDITTPAGWTVVLASRSRSYEAPRSLIQQPRHKPGSIPLFPREPSRNTLAYSIPPGNTEGFTLTFTPVTWTTYSGIVTITSNDPNNPVKEIQVSGIGLASNISVLPLQLDETLAEGVSVNRDIRIQNTGNDTLFWTMTQEDRSAGRGSGGPDNFGYLWIDSDEIGGPTVSWTDISITGTPLTNWTPTGSYSALDEGYSGPVPLGFNLDYYDEVVTEVYVSSNGFISNEFMTTHTYSNYQLPNATASPFNKIAPLWDDLEGINGTVYFQQFRGFTIIQYDNWSYYSNPASSLTFQIILYDSGNIVFNYNLLAGLTIGHTIGISNTAGNDGFSVVHNQPYLHVNLTVNINRPDGTDWLTVNDPSGSILPSEYFDASVTVNATGFDPDFYYKNLLITNNDPDTPLVTIPVTMEVTAGQPNIYVDSDSLWFGYVDAGLTSQQQFTITNTGGGTLSGSITTPPGYTVAHAARYRQSQSGFLNVAVLKPEPVANIRNSINFDLTCGASRTYDVTFAPDTHGNFYGDILISSNDADEPTSDFPLDGVGEAGEMDTNPDLFNFATWEGQSDIQQLRLENLGNDNLIWSLSSQSSTRDSGGPDNYGYIWKDSNEPTGPVFNWQDISLTGTPLTLADDDYESVVLPFTFNFYGTDYTSVKVSSNGYLCFGVNATSYTNGPIPSTTVPDNFIAPFWDDLKPIGVNAQGDWGTVYTWSDPLGDYFVVQYHQVSHYHYSAPVNPETFQAILYSNGSIEFHYWQVSSGDFSSVGNDSTG